MNRDPYLPLTETTYYTLVSLLEPCHGYKILNRIKELSNGQVHVAPGTLYGALENLEKHGLIRLVEEVGSRKKVFRIADKGLAVLEKDRQRLIHMTRILENYQELPFSSENKSSEEKEEEREGKSSEVDEGMHKTEKIKKKREEDLFY